jgi:hypothetical protein
MEVFFVVLTACVLLGFGAWALLAVRHVLTLSGRRPGDS